MYPVGFLFGLGFDTMTEVALLSLAATQAAQGLPMGTMLIFPALFAAAMVLVDTADSILMVEAYGWAFVHPLRKLWYNLTITGTSVAVALLIGGIQALGLLAGGFDLRDGIWPTIVALNDNIANLGFVVIGVCAFGWLSSALVFRWKHRDLANAP